MEKISPRRRLQYALEDWLTENGIKWDKPLVDSLIELIARTLSVSLKLW